VKARTIHEDKSAAGLPLTNTFHDHLVRIMKSDAKNPEVQNRYDQSLARDPHRPGPDISFSGNEAKPLFHDTGNGFVEIGTTMGISRTEDCRGFVLVDLDGDGALDVVMHNFFRNPIVALLNRAAGEGRWLRVRLRGTKSNRFGIGARVTVNGKVQDLFCGSGYQSCSAPELHFGLGKAEKADVVVRWPSGWVEKYAQVEANRIHTFVEGDPSGHRVEELKRETIVLPEPAPPKPDVEARSLLKGLLTLEGGPAGIEEPAIVILFSTACHACVEDLKRMAELETQAKELGVRLAWVTIDPDVKKVEEEFRLNGAPVMPLRPGGPVSVMSTPTVYFVSPKRLEKYTGRFAVTAVFSEAARLLLMK
jgi:hypothetical protein